MFGYVRTDTPYLFVKDQTLYQAMYCSLCKGISQTCGQCARIGLSYDVTFLSILLHNIKGIDVKIEKQHCLTHCIRSKQMALVDDLTRQLGALNTLLAYYKCADDVEDGDGGKAKKLLFKQGFKSAKKKYPELERIVRENLREQAAAEQMKTESLDRAADATAKMLREVSDYVLEDKATAETRQLFYALGKWIYLIDALDDYDKDQKKGAYNPFVLRFKHGCKQQLMQSSDAEEVRFAFHSLFFDIRESISKIEFCFNRDLLDNILLRGLPMTTKQVMDGVDCKKCKPSNKKNKNHE